MAADPFRTSRCPVGQECPLDKFFRPRRGEQASLGRTRSGRQYRRRVVYTEDDVNLIACMYQVDLARVESELFRLGGYDMNASPEKNAMHYVLHYVLYTLNNGY